MTSVINHFLLIYDHKVDQLVDMREFGHDAQAAMDAYSEMERKHADDAAMDIVLVGSDSIETVKVTHGNYFTGVGKSLIRGALSDIKEQLDLACDPVST